MMKSFKKSVSLVLCFLMVLSVFVSMPFTASAANDYTINSTTSTDNYYNLISKKDWDIAPGITESEIVLNNDDGTQRQVLFVMEADTNNEYVKVVNSYSGMKPEYGSYSTGVMSQQAAYAEANGYGNVVGAMNTCLSWYSGYSEDRVGEPLGFIMYDAEIFFDPSNCGYDYGNVGFPSVLVINKDFDENGNPRPEDIPKVEMPQITSAADLDGWEEQVIPASSGYIVKDGVNVNSPSHTGGAPRSVVGIKPDGTVVIMLNDGRQAPYSTGMSMYELAEVMLDLGCSYAVNCDGGGSSTYLSQRPGEELKVNNSPSDGSERPTTSGILFISTAPANGEFYKAHVSTENEYYTPNSSVQFNAIGTDMGGTEVDIPADATWNLSDSSFGTIDNTGLFTSNGKEGEVTAQLVYNETVFGEATITIVLPDIAFRQDTIVIGYGDTMMLPIDVTTNEGRNAVTYRPEDIVYTLSDDALGTLDGDQFTACDASAGLTGGTITAVICGQTDKTVSAEIRFGKASEIIYDYEDGQFLVDTDPEVAPAEGEPYGWFIRDTRSNGYFAYRFFAKKAYTPIGLDIPAQVYLVDRENGMVKNGNYAMGIDIDWTNVTASCHGQMDVFLPESLDLTDATSVGFWMYVPAELVTDSMQIRVGFLNEDGSSAVVTNKITDFVGNTSGVENGGWFYFSWEVLDSYKTFEYFQINSHYTAGEGNYNYYQDVTYFVDDITVDYSDATIDRENPYFTSMSIADEYTNGDEISGQTITTNTIDLMAQAYENTTKTNYTGLDRNSVKLYVDGALSDVNIAMSAGGTITASDLYLNDGVHTLVMEVSDNQGNVGNIVRKLVVNTNNSAVRLEVPTPEVDLLPTGSVYWLNLVADNLAEIDSVTTTINLDYVNDWELEGMEVAYGFEAEYYINNHNDAVITFTRTKTEVADTTILAKLPVRIWMAKGWMDDSGIRAQYISDDYKMQDKYYILTPHAMWYSDGTRDYRLVVSAEAGVVTYLDGRTETFSANETVIQTEMNRYYTNANRQGKWSFHICTPGTAESKPATCTENGYENRVFCVGCACGSVDNLGTECDNHNGCGSVIDWGTILPANGHTLNIVDGKLTCDCGYTIDETGVVDVDGIYYYLIAGSLQSGWHMIDDEWYYFDTTTYAGLTGYINGSDVIFTTRDFDYLFENGKLLKGAWVTVEDGVRYYYGPDYYKKSWRTIDDNRYYFDVNGNRVTGIYCLQANAAFGGSVANTWYEFDENGVLIAPITGIVSDSNGTYYVENGTPTFKGLFEYNGDIYYADKNGNIATGAVYAEKTNGVLPEASYMFGSDGKLVSSEPLKNGLNKDEDGEIRFYENGTAIYAGLVQDDDGNLYYINSSLKAVKNCTYTIYSHKTNGLKEAGTYSFDAEGKMYEPKEIKNGLIKDEDGEIRYYVNDVAVYAGLVQDDDGNLYYINSSLKAVKNCTYTIYSHMTNGLKEAGTYSFDAEGKMYEPKEIKNGLIKDEDGETRYYINDVAVYAGLVQDDDGNLYYINSSLKAVKNCTYTIYSHMTNGLKEAGTYSFDAEGKMYEPKDMKNGLIKDEDGEIRYYVNDVAVYAGLVQDDDGNLYYINSSLKAVKNCTYTIYSHMTNGLKEAGTYQFDADGKMVQ